MRVCAHIYIMRMPTRPYWPAGKGERNRAMKAGREKGEVPLKRFCLSHVTLRMTGTPCCRVPIPYARDFYLLMQGKVEAHTQV